MWPEGPAGKGAGEMTGGLFYGFVSWLCEVLGRDGAAQEAYDEAVAW